MPTVTYAGAEANDGLVPQIPENWFFTVSPPTANGILIIETNNLAQFMEGAVLSTLKSVYR